MISKQKNRLTVACAVATCFIVASGASQLATAQAATQFPSKPLTIIVPFSAGGPFDIIARQLSVPLAKELGQSVIVQNLPGASGMIGTGRVANSAPDGYTLLLGSSGTQALNPNIYAKLPYKSPNDFRPIAELARIPSLLLVGEKSPFKNIDEFLIQLKSTDSSINMGNAGPGSVSNLAALNFLSAAGAKVTSIPYKGTAPAYVDLISGEIDSLFDTAVQALPHVDAGRARVLAVTSKNRLAKLPNVPTLSETCCPGTELMIWYGIFSPAGTPDDVQAILTKGVLAARNSPEFVRAMVAGEAEVPSNDEDVAAFAAKIERDIAHFGDLVTASGMEKM